jgi:Mg/Co/Ni transporter MgtE (contains CBS domain)
MKQLNFKGNNMAYAANENIHTTLDPSQANNLKEGIMKYIRTDFPRLSDTLTVEMALRVIRQNGIGERIVYFYVLDRDEKLVGIVPTRRLLTSMPRVRISEIMVKNIISASHRATILEICEMFVKHKLLAFPVLDDDGRMVGIVDAGLFTEEELTFAERHRFDDVFQFIGFGLSQVKGKSAFGIFRYRFPWLLATIASGITCALLTGLYEATLAQALVLAFFMTLVLALGESVSIQSMTVALQQLHFRSPTLADYFSMLRREISATALLGAVCGLIVGSIAFAWRGEFLPSVVISISIMLSVTMAGVIGLTIPTVLHAVHEESKIASGPLTLAFADVVTILLYFNAASMILR